MNWRAAAVGMCLALLNGAAWSAFLRSVTPLSAELPGVYAPPPESMRLAEGRLDVNLDTCADCPEYALLGKGVMGFYAPLHLKLLWWVNAPALWLAANETLRYGVRVVRPWLFFPLASLQWIVLGYVGYGGVRRYLARNREVVSSRA